jgi:periplasmic protein TonB
VNPTLRRGIPWVAALLLHAAVLLVPTSMRVAPRVRPDERRIDLVFDQPAPRASSPASSLPAREQVQLPAGAAPSLPRAQPPSELPSALSGPAAPLDDRLVDLAAAQSSPFPSPRDVLQSLPAPAATASSAAFTASPSDPALADVSAAPATIAWQGRSRGGAIRRTNPEFPRVMSRTGQEGECAARITVTPSGTVSRVEIVRSSGYPEIDATVASALRGWLFAKAEGQSSVAIISYPFRLEIRD